MFKLVRCRRHSREPRTTGRGNGTAKIQRKIDMIDEIKAAMAELEYAGIIERTGEMQWDEHHHEWQPVYAHTELRRALSAAGISVEEYQNRAS
jgi:hypothetical protein